MGTFHLGFSVVRILENIPGEEPKEDKAQGDAREEHKKEVCAEQHSNENPQEEGETGAEKPQCSNGGKESPQGCKEVEEEPHGSNEGEEENDWDDEESGTTDGSVWDSETEDDCSSSLEEDEDDGQAPENMSKTKGIPQEAYDECVEAFKLFDRDGNGTISYDELADVMRLLGNNPTDKEIKEMMAGLDDDKNGTIDFEEFMAIMISHWKDPVNEEEELLHAFEVFDRNKDGFVVAEEIRYVMKSLGHTMTDSEIDAIIKEGDSNGDGRLDYHEFIKVMQGRL